MAKNIPTDAISNIRNIFTILGLFKGRKDSSIWKVHYGAMQRTLCWSPCPWTRFDRWTDLLIHRASSWMSQQHELQTEWAEGHLNLVIITLEKVFSDYLSLLHGFSHIPSSGDRNKKNGEWSVQDIS